MNIAIDTTPLTSAHKNRGVGSYTKNLIEALQKYENKHSYTLFTRGQKIPDTVDIVHYPYFDPFFLTLPLNKPKPTVVTVHDLTPIIFPDKFPPGLRGSIKWQIQKTSLKGAGRIITDSKNSKKDIARIIDFDEGKIDVVYLAPGPMFSPGTHKHVGAPYILYVGDINWNKNIPELRRAFALVHDRRPRMQLILVGEAFGNRLTEKELIELYRGARLLVLPSHYEGFGFPVLEAMAAGCPVVAADTSSVSEIAGPAIRVKPDADSIASGMEKCLSLSQRARTDLIDKGFAWVQKFTWQRVAHETVASYERSFK